MTLISFIKTQIHKIRKAPYTSDQKGIIRRYFREQSNWDHHLNKTKAFISQSVSQYNGGKVAVLGSGWLLDVPMQELIDKFDQIWLFDICHPLAIKRRFAQNRKIKFIEIDLNNGLFEQIVHLQTKSKILLCINSTQPCLFNTKFDFMISVNLLNQLDILLVDHLIKRFSWENEELLQIRKKLQQNHLNILLRQPSCLISDYEELRWVDIDIVENQNLVFVEYPEGNMSDEWIWIFDTHKYYHKNFNISFKVKALTF